MSFGLIISNNYIFKKFPSILSRVNLGKINIHNSKKTNENPGIANYRGIGVSEMVASINHKRLNRFVCVNYRTRGNLQ